MYQKQLEVYANTVQAALETYLPDTPGSLIVEAMRYSLLSPGKRIRPLLALEFARVCGGDPAVKSCMPLACALEMIHCYSLIHDDLPCMDDDEYRRGRYTNHVVYGEDFAVLAGDGLLTHAFWTASRAEGMTLENKLFALSKLAELSGLDGMLGGQAVDVETDGRLPDLDSILDMYRGKTGALIRLSAYLGCAAANATQEQYDAALRYTAAVGLAFQIRDDLLDVEQDIQEQRATYATVAGTEASEIRIRELTEEAKVAAAIFVDNGFLSWLADYLAGRTI